MRNSDFRELKIWQKAMDLTVEVYRLVKLLPKEEKYGLSDQLRRAVVSIPSNIAEGHGRNSDKEFVQFLYIARGSLLEVQTQIEISTRLNLINIIEVEKAQLMITEISKMLNSLISYRLTLKSKT